MPAIPRWLENLIVAVGGGTVVLVGALTLCKNLVVKLFETGIESSFEKNLEKFKNKLERSTRAYEMLLEREMRFYERMEPISAKLIPLAHDFTYCITLTEEVDRKDAAEAFRDSVLKYGEILKLLKNEGLTHQTYIPANIFSTVTEIVKQMQEDFPFLVDTAKLLLAEEHEKVDRKRIDENYDQLINRLADLNGKIKARLEELSDI